MKTGSLLLGLFLSAIPVFLLLIFVPAFGLEMLFIVVAAVIALLVGHANGRRAAQEECATRKH